METVTSFQNQDFRKTATVKWEPTIKFPSESNITQDTDTLALETTMCVGADIKLKDG